MNKKILDILEYEKLKHLADKYLSTAAGMQELNELTPVADLKSVQEMIEETTDAADINRLVGPIPVPTLDDISAQLKRLRVHASLNGTELAQIAKVLRATMSMTNFFERLQDDQVELRRLYEIQNQLVTIPDVTKR